MKTSATKERPILLGGLWVRAIIEGRKTQTRRPVPRPEIVDGSLAGWRDRFDNLNSPLRCPFGSPGDLLWVRETWAPSGYYKNGQRYEYRAFPRDGAHFRSVGRWRPSIHMPREASRLTLEILNVRAERLQGMTEADAVAEGVSSRTEFIARWDETYPKAALWAWNPFVWAIEFRVAEGGGR